MLYDHRTIVNWLFERSRQDDKPLSLTQSIKLCYIAHGWYLERFNQPLIKGRLEAWSFGAVYPGIQQDYKTDSNLVESAIQFQDKPLSQQALDHMEIIYDIYADQDPFSLTALIKERGGAWDTAIRTRGAFTIIGTSEIRSHFLQIRAQAR